MTMPPDSTAATRRHLTLGAKIEQYLLTQAEPLLMGDICEGLGLTRGVSASASNAARRWIGAKLIEQRRKGFNGSMHTYFSIVGAKARPAPILTPPPDLWRGWYNPKTGRTGARLGPG